MRSCEKQSLPFSPSYLLSLDIEEDFQMSTWVLVCDVEVHLTCCPGHWRLGEAGGSGRQVGDGGGKVVGGRSGGGNR